ncbi:malectin-A [Anopheles cruzii]|uniref:malectin-A n=1 Tax=Anopheles cruzii TaxID=68878 RepID=UPI0022EC6C7D|nr:malectin-A [Anopheles cruzii]
MLPHPHPACWLIWSGLWSFVAATNGELHNVVYAINAGGEAHIDSYGIHYARDPLMGKIGTESDYGRQLLAINRVKPNDEILYQTERYHHDTFGYDLPLAGDGEYVLILKFCEVYFNGPNMKVFDVLLNRHTIVSDLDIFALVGKGTAHDEYVFFSVSRGRLYYKEENSEVRGGKVKLEFLKGYKDNPKVNAIVLIKSYDEASLPRLGPIRSEPGHGSPASTGSPSKAYPGPLDDGFQEAAEDSIMDDFFTGPSPSSESVQQSPPKQRKTSGPKQPNPYSLDESSMMLPVFIAIGAFIPLLFCLCRL